MSFINPTASSVVKSVTDPKNQPVIATPDKAAGEHLNWMGGISFDINDPLLRLQVAASSCFFGEPMYYHKDSGDKRPKRVTAPQRRARLNAAQLTKLRDTLGAVDPAEWRSLTPADLMVKAIDEALAHDPEKTLEFAAFLRQTLHIRTTPQVIMVRAALLDSVKGTGLITKYATAIIGRLDEVTVQYAYFLSLGKGKTPPKNLKRNWARAIQRANEYQLAKYRMEGRSVNLYDVVNISHPKGPLIDKLMKGKLKLGGDGRKTWESIRSGGGSWTEAAAVMGHMALLRNLRNLSENDALTKELCDKLVAGAAKGKQLPFRYFSAFKALEGKAKSGLVFDAIEAALEASIGNLPRFSGRVCSLVDNSGSAWGTTTSSMGSMHMASIGNLMGVLTGKASDEGHIGIFGDHLKMRPVRKKESTFDALKAIDQIGRNEVGGATEHGVWLFWRDAIKQRQHWDTVFVYSDMQAGHGGLYGNKPGEYADYLWGDDGYARYIDVAKLVKTYREKVNPKVNVFLVQIAGYQDTLIPEFYDRTYILGGWSDQLLRFAAQMIAMTEQAPTAQPPSQEPSAT